MHARRLALAAACLAALLAPSAHAAIVDETYSVPTVGGARISVEVQRDDKFPKQPIILTYSPYNTLTESPGGTVANDGIAKTYNPKGYARAVADVVGTRNSTGCWDYGGPREQQSGVDVINALARQPWSNGKVAMIGGSYDGTTANMVAVRGADVPGLAAIVPQSAINHWYGYAYQDGVRYSGNTENPSDEGIDTPLGFDFGLARTPPTHPDQADQEMATDLATGRYNPCDSADHTAHGYDSTPDYDAFWLSRDYLKDASRVRVPVLVTHGWQDYNVKMSEGTDFYEALGPRVPFKKLFMFQGPHAGAPAAQYGPVLERFFAHTLKGVDNGIDREPAVVTQGRDGTTKDKDFRSETAWPPPATRGLALDLGRDGAGAGLLAAGATGGPASYSDGASNTEEGSLQSPASEGGWLFYETPPLAATVRLARRALLHAPVAVDQDAGQLAPTLVDMAPDGTATPISRGFLNLQYRNGLTKAEPVPAGKAVRARVRLAPQDQTVDKGHRIGLLVESSNVGWALPSQPGQYTLTQGAPSRLVLPGVGPLAGVATTPAPLPDARPAPPFGPQRAKPASRRARVLTVSARRRGRVLRISGRAPSGSRVKIRVTQRHARKIVRRVRARRGRYRATVRLHRRAAARVSVTTRRGARTYRASRVVR